jgi:hypothetical protein
MVRENAGKVAISRGPFVYCIEEVDNGSNLQMLMLNKDTEFIKDGEFLIADGFREAEDSLLYSEYNGKNETSCKIKFLPYYRWANRGENEMQIYIRI